MNKIDLLAKIILNEAPLSSYVKKAGSKLVNPAAYARGAGSLLRGAGSAAGVFTTSSKSLAGTLGGAGNIATSIGGGLSKVGQSLSPEDKAKQKTDLSTSKGQIPADFSKAKTDMVINNQSFQAKYMGETKTGYPAYQIQGLPWAKSFVVEPKEKNKAVIYMYADRKPNIRKQPASIRPGTINFSGVQNKLVITTK